MIKIKDHSLYLIISGEYCLGRDPVDVAKKAIAGGVDMVQLREKNMHEDELVALGGELAGLCRKNGVIFIINDDSDIAQKTGADGVHLGKEDLKKFPLQETRKLLGPKKIIGVSAGSLRDVAEVSGSDADYMGYGPVFETVVKDGSTGTAEIRDVLAVSKKPVFFLGGIGLDNVDYVLDLGAKNISLIRAICASDDIEKAAREFRRKLDQRRKTSRTG